MFGSSVLSSSSIATVRLESLDGQFVELAVSGYQFGSARSTSSGVDWDANWLILRGKVWDGSQSWEFNDPCMTTWEARELAAWLRGLGTALAVAEPGATKLWLTEPNLTFSVVESSQGVTTLDVHFDAESRPALGSNDEGDGLGHRVRLVVPQHDIAQAANHWEQGLAQFPVR